MQQQQNILEHIGLFLLIISTLVTVLAFLYKLKVSRKTKKNELIKDDQELFNKKIGLLYDELFENQFSEQFDPAILTNDGFNAINIYKLCSRVVEFKNANNRFALSKVNKAFRKLYKASKPIYAYVQENEILTLKSVMHPNEFSAELLQARKKDFYEVKKHYKDFHKAIFGYN